MQGVQEVKLLLLCMAICVTLLLIGFILPPKEKQDAGEILLEEIANANEMLGRTPYPVVMELRSNLTLDGREVQGYYKNTGYYQNNTIVLDAEWGVNHKTIRHELCHHILATDCSTPFGGNMAFEESFCELYGWGSLNEDNYAYAQLDIPRQNIEAFLECGMKTCDAKGCFEKYRYYG